MIDFLRGNVVHLESEYIVLDVRDTAIVYLLLIRMHLQKRRARRRLYSS